MYNIYILQSLTDNKLYVGFTKNLTNRLNKHKNGLVKSTKNRRPFKLVYLEDWKNSNIARRSEKYLKSLYGYREKYKLIKNYKNKSYLI